MSKTGDIVVEQMNIVRGENICMWCGQPGGYPFCVGGGKLPMGGQSRSYCFQSFRAIMNSEKRMQKIVESHTLTKEQNFVATHMEVFTDWLKGLPTVGEDDI